MACLMTFGTLIADASVREQEIGIAKQHQLL